MDFKIVNPSKGRSGSVNNLEDRNIRIIDKEDKI
jgi:hypothetical protein